MSFAKDMVSGFQCKVFCSYSVQICSLPEDYLYMVLMEFQESFSFPNCGHSLLDVFNLRKIQVLS